MFCFDFRGVMLQALQLSCITNLLPMVTNQFLGGIFLSIWSEKYSL